MFIVLGVAETLTFSHYDPLAKMSARQNWTIAAALRKLVMIFAEAKEVRDEIGKAKSPSPLMLLCKMGVKQRGPVVHPQSLTLC